MCQPITQEEAAINDGVQKMTAQEEDPTHPLAKTWVRLYRSFPTINLPGTNFNISFSLFSAAFLYLVRLTIKMSLVKGLGWPEDSLGLEESTGSLAAIVHSINLVPGLFVALLSQPYRPTAHLNTAPQWWQDLVTALLQFCTGYMIYDSVTSFILPKGFGGIAGSDWLFLGHHFATAMYMTQCRVLEAGHTSAMICMLLGEFTNPFQNGHTVLGHSIKEACCNGAVTQLLFQVFEFCFAFSYFSIRALIAPFFLVHVTYALLCESSRSNIPFGLRMLWIFMIWAVEFGSYPWIVECWNMLQRHLGLTVSDAEL